MTQIINSKYFETWKEKHKQIVMLNSFIKYGNPKYIRKVHRFGDLQDSVLARKTWALFYNCLYSSLLSIVENIWPEGQAMSDVNKDSQIINSATRKWKGNNQGPQPINWRESVTVGHFWCSDWFLRKLVIKHPFCKSAASSAAEGRREHAFRSVGPNRDIYRK